MTLRPQPDRLKCDYAGCSEQVCCLEAPKPASPCTTLAPIRLNEDGVAVAAAVAAPQPAAASKSTFSWAMPLMGVGCLLAFISFFVARRHRQIRSTREISLNGESRSLTTAGADIDLEEYLE